VSAHSRRLPAALLLLVCAALSGVQPAADVAAQAWGGLQQEDFTRIATGGFGDRQNGWAWAMAWWHDYLYVGTNRAFHCTEMAALNRFLPRLFPYPPEDPDVVCTRDPDNLPLQAEIWRWHAPTNRWERVYQSPAVIPIDGRPGKFLPYDIGYRGMIVFRESDGSEALYVTGVSAQFLGHTVPPPRILRSVDGVTFTPVPQRPGTTLGDYMGNNFRNPIAHNGNLYLIGGSIQGSGVLFEANEPMLGNNFYRIVSPPDVIVSAAASFNNQLYIGVRSVTEGYSVMRTTATGRLPYTWKTVVSNGGYVADKPNSEILSMRAFRDALYIGGNGVQLGPAGVSGPADLIRVHPDDSWDLIVGEPRYTPDGLKAPLSRYSAGFGSVFNAHMWRMEVFNNRLYVGTFDSSTTVRTNPDLAPYIQDIMGFDLYESLDGRTFRPITTTGFGDKFNFGARTMVATPYGLFLGTANYYYGLQVWNGLPDGFKGHRIHLPLLSSAPGSVSNRGGSAG
jgi:hypothetical protein